MTIEDLANWVIIIIGFWVGWFLYDWIQTKRRNK